MPKSKGKTSQRSDRKDNRKGAASARFEGISKRTAQIAKDAAALLDEELAAGIVAANRVRGVSARIDGLIPRTSAKHCRGFRPTPTR